MICQLDANDYCKRHGMIHKGKLKDLSQDRGEAGEKFRNTLDKWIADGKPISKPVPMVSTNQCRFLGNPTGELVKCTSCVGKTDVKLFICENPKQSGFTECTIKKPVAGTACCAGWPQHSGVLKPCQGYLPAPTAVNTEPIRFIEIETPQPPTPAVNKGMQCRTIRHRRPVKWSYGVTTVPSRRGNLLPRTLASLAAAGFNKPRLFVDGDTDWQSWASEFKTDVTCRYPLVRTASNWMLSIAELYLRDPLATYYALFQDDFVTYQNLRSYLEVAEYPDGGYWNLYTFPENEDIRPKDHYGWYQSNQGGKGAVALVFSNKVLRALLSHTHLVDRPLSLNRGHKAIDGGIVWAIRKMGGREYVHYPSLVQHTGTQSSMGNQKQPFAKTFLGETFDARTFIG